MSSNTIEEKITSDMHIYKKERKHVLPIYALITGNSVSYIGNTLTLLAIPWFVLQTTGSVTQAGIVGFFSVLSRIISSMLGSALIERLGYRRISVIGDLLSGLAVLLVPLLYYTMGLAFWELLILVFLSGMLGAPASTARFALLPNLAELAGMRLERVNAFEEAVVQMSVLLGAPLAGILIASIGASNLLWLDAASFAFSALIIGLFVPARMSVEKQAQTMEEGETAEKQSYFAILGESLSFLFTKDAVQCTLLVIFIITNMLDSANAAVVLPAYVLQTYHTALPLGLLYAALGGMGFVGTLIFAAIGHRLPRRLTCGLSFIISGAIRFWILLIPNFPIQLIWFALAGLVFGPINPLIHTIIQERTPREKLPRIMGVGVAIVMSGMPLGALAGGFVITWIGMRTTLVAMGAIYLVVTLSILVNPKLKEMEKV